MTGARQLVFRSCLAAGHKASPCLPAAPFREGLKSICPPWFWTGPLLPTPAPSKKERPSWAENFLRATNQAPGRDFNSMFLPHTSCFMLSFPLLFRRVLKDVFSTKTFLFRLKGFKISTGFLFSTTKTCFTKVNFDWLGDSSNIVSNAPSLANHGEFGKETHTFSILSLQC